MNKIARVSSRLQASALLGYRHVCQPPGAPSLSQIRGQHTNTAASHHDKDDTTARGLGNDKTRGQTSRAGVTALILVGLAGAYGLRQMLQKDIKKSLNNSTFTPFQLVAKDQVSSTCSIFTLEQASLPTTVIEDMQAQGVWSIEIKQPQLQIARSYTPLPPLPSASSNVDNQLRLLVRKEQKGEMSNYIHKKPINADLELRGPVLEHNLPPNVHRVVFLAGGTGIAPALQLAHALQAKDCDHMSVLWANRKREECEGGKSDTRKPSKNWLSSLAERIAMSANSPQQAQDEHVPSSSNAIVRQLHAMKQAHQGRLTVDYYVDEESTIISPKDVLATISDPLSSTGGHESGEKLIFVSGPDGFLSYWAGPKEWRDGREVQGPLGGALSRMDLQGWRVVKL